MADIENLERKLDNLTKLVDINSIINSTLDMGKLLNIIMEIIKEIMETETSTMLLYEEEADDLVFRVALGEAGDKLTERYRVAMGQGIAGWVAQKRKPVIVNDVYKDERFDPEFDKSTGFVTRSILCAPLLYKGRLLGVIQAINPLNKAGFDSADRSLFLVFFRSGRARGPERDIFFQRHRRGAHQERTILGEIDPGIPDPRYQRKDRPGKNHCEVPACARGGRGVP